MIKPINPFFFQFDTQNLRRILAQIIFVYQIEIWEMK